MVCHIKWHCSYFQIIWKLVFIALRSCNPDNVHICRILGSPASVINCGKMRFIIMFNSECLYKNCLIKGNNWFVGSNLYITNTPRVYVHLNTTSPFLMELKLKFLYRVIEKSFQKLSLCFRFQDLDVHQEYVKTF